MYKLSFAFVAISGLSAVLSASSALANDIDDRVNFFLGQPNTVTLRSAARRSSAGSIGDAPLVFRIPASAITSTRTPRATSYELQTREGGMPALFDDTPALRQYPVASVYEDPTLRKGDLVVTGNGIRVFRGSIGDTHRQNDFVKWQPGQSSKRERADILALEKVITPAVVAQSVKQASSHARSVVIPIATRSVDQAMLPSHMREKQRRSQGLSDITLR